MTRCTTLVLAIALVMTPAFAASIDFAAPSAQVTQALAAMWIIHAGGGLTTPGITTTQIPDFTLEYASLAGGDVNSATIQFGGGFNHLAMLTQETDVNGGTAGYLNYFLCYSDTYVSSVNFTFSDGATVSGLSGKPGIPGQIPAFDILAGGLSKDLLASTSVRVWGIALSTLYQGTVQQYSGFTEQSGASRTYVFTGTQDVEVLAEIRGDVHLANEPEPGTGKLGLLGVGLWLALMLGCGRGRK